MRLLCRLLSGVLLVAGTASKSADLPDGKYVFFAPALFGSNEEGPRGMLCELEDGGGRRQLHFLNNPLSRGSTISFLRNGTSIKFTESHMPSTEVGRTITGQGSVRGDGTASGSLTVSMGSVGFLLAKRQTSEWSLRKASAEEVRASVTEGLRKAEQLVWASRGIERPTSANVANALHSVVGFGYSEKDVPLLERMIASGELQFENWKSRFRDEVPSPVAGSAPSISTNVVTQDALLVPLKTWRRRAHTRPTPCRRRFPGRRPPAEAGSCLFGTGPARPMHPHPPASRRGLPHIHSPGPVRVAQGVPCESGRSDSQRWESDSSPSPRGGAIDEGPSIRRLP
jgi:hypothetical protein